MMIFYCDKRFSMRKKHYFYRNKRLQPVEVDIARQEDMQGYPACV